MELITLNKNNLQTEHICCAIANNNDCQVASKKAWLSDRFDDGLVFTKGNVRGKCFIEYIPAEKAWAPIEAPGYMYVDCLWVSGQFKGQGYSSLLLDSCLNDSRAKGKLGLVALSSKKKMAFLSDPEYLRHKGFRLADQAEPYFELLYLPFSEEAGVPKFRPSVKLPPEENSGYVLYYSNQCPYPAKYVPLVQEAAEKLGVSVKTVRYESAEQAQNAACPFTTYSFFLDGKLLTHEILSVPKMEKILKVSK